MEGRAHVLAASGELQANAFARILRELEGEVTAYVLWASDPSKMPYIPSVTVKNLIDPSLNYIKREVLARKLFKKAMDEITSIHGDRITIYANGAQHFFGNNFVFARPERVVQLLDGMSTFVPRPVFVSDRCKMLAKAAMGFISGLPYVTYSGDDILMSANFDDRDVKQSDYLRDLPLQPGGGRSVLFFDQGLFEIASCKQEKIIRAKAISNLKMRFDTILYRRHPRTQAGAFIEDEMIIDVSKINLQEICVKYSVSAVASFYSTALLEISNVDRIAFLPKHSVKERKTYVDNLKKFITSQSIELVEV